MADTNFAASPVPIEKSADFEMDGQREFVKSSLPVGGRIEATEVAERLTVTPDFEDVGATYKPKKDGRGFRRSRIPLGERNALLMAPLSKVLLRYF